MLPSRVVTVVSFLIAVFYAISAMPEPGIIRERHVIHAPIKIKTIHHYKIKKVPVIIRKHLHYHKPREEIHTKEEEHTNQVHYDEDVGGHHNEYPHQQKGHPKDESYETSFQDGRYEVQEEDYDDTQQSQEEEEEEEEEEEGRGEGGEYEDYEYK